MNNSEIINRLARLESLDVVKSAKKKAQQVGFLAGGVTVLIDVAEAVDINEEKEKIRKEIVDAEKYIKTLEIKLSNKDFTARAPGAVVAGEKEKLKKANEKMEKLQAELKHLS